MTTVSTLVGLEPSTATLSPTEVVTALRALSDGEKAALIKVARAYAARTDYSHEDLFQEAVCRVLSGARSWPRNVAVMSFLVGVMRSIAWEWRSAPQAEAGDAADPQSGESNAIASIDLVKIVKLFDDDPVAQRVVIAMMEGARGQELQDLCGLSKTAYESKRTKIRRRIEKSMLWHRSRT
jgi:DNA-directed RNA polymerase specialized sigma24 family protein